ncbi:MAG: class I SAM-dependent methyltransferase [Bryobacterales bacterium]|nr:class I SAM-dependent methyltransferase [Bryobacterales bacterium]
MTLAEVDFFENVLAPAPGAHILDIPCGGGRHSIELARRGYRMTGFDISAQFLAIARRNAQAAGVPVEFRRGDMVQPPDGPFDAAFCYGNSFGYLTHNDTRTFLSGVGRSLRAGARFLLETGTAAETILPTFQPESEFNFGGIRMQTTRNYRFRDSTIESVYRFSRDGMEESHRLEQAVYTTGEICRMLQGAGFAVVQLHSGTDGSPMRMGASRRLLIAAEKE